MNVGQYLWIIELYYNHKKKIYKTDIVKYFFRNVFVKNYILSLVKHSKCKVQKLIFFFKMVGFCNNWKSIAK